MPNEVEIQEASELRDRFLKLAEGAHFERDAAQFAQAAATFALAGAVHRLAEAAES